MRLVLPFLPAGAFVAVLGLFFLHYSTYLPTGGEVINQGDFEFPTGVETSGATPNAPRALWEGWGETAAWAPNEGYRNTGGVRLTAREDMRGHLEYVYPNPNDHEHLLLAGRIRTRAVRPGPYLHSRARLLLYFRDSAGNVHWEHPHTACALTGTKRWRKYRWVFPVPAWAATAHVCLQQAGRSGVMWVDDLSLTPVRLNPTFHWWQGMIFAVSGGVGLGYLLYLRLLHRRNGRWVALLACGIVAGALCPTEVFGKTVGWVIRLGQPDTSLATASVRHPAEEPDAARERTATEPCKVAPGTVSRGEAELKSRLTTGVKSGGHALSFAVLAFLSCLVFAGARAAAPSHDHRGRQRVRRDLLRGAGAGNRARACVTLTANVMFASTTELLQSATLSRHPLLEDWLLDLSGAALGFALFTSWRYLRRRKCAA
ncbi:MAG: VanZ family protein [Kiritimatiellae bacterium]|nr:VanZ family protein [Kiritimatiellia bacterium]